MCEHKQCKHQYSYKCSMAAPALKMSSSHEQFGLISCRFVVCSGGHILSANGFYVQAGHVRIRSTMTSVGPSLIPVAHTSEEAPACM